MVQREIPVDVRVTVAVSRRVQGEQLNVAALCRELPLSRDWFYELERRARQGGLEAVLEPRSRRPMSSPGQTSAAIEDLVVLLRKELTEQGWDCGASSILSRLPARMAADPLLAGLTVPSRATVHRILVRRGQVTAQPRKRPKFSRRFEYPHPNACWQVDATEWHLADGSVVSIVQILDDNSRKLLAHNVAAGETTTNVWTAFTKAFSRHGLPSQVLSDKGIAMLGWPGVVTQVRRNLRALGIHCVTSRGYHPQTCGKNERVHQTLHTWLRARPAAATIEQLQQLCDAFELAYNTERPHQALGGITPDERYYASPRLGPGGQPAPEPVIVSHNTVSGRGIVTVGHWQVGVGRRWEGCEVLVVRQDLHAAVFYRQELLTELEIDPTKLYQPSGKPSARPPRKIRIKDQQCQRCPETSCPGCLET